MSHQFVGTGTGALASQLLLGGGGGGAGIAAGAPLAGGGAGGALGGIFGGIGGPVLGALLGGGFQLAQEALFAKPERRKAISRGRRAGLAAFGEARRREAAFREDPLIQRARQFLGDIFEPGALAENFGRQIAAQAAARGVNLGAAPAVAAGLGVGAFQQRLGLEATPIAQAFAQAPNQLFLETLQGVSPAFFSAFTGAPPIPGQQAPAPFVSQILPSAFQGGLAGLQLSIEGQRAAALQSLAEQQFRDTQTRSPFTAARQSIAQAAARF